MRSTTDPGVMASARAPDLPAARWVLRSARRAPMLVAGATVAVVCTAWATSTTHRYHLPDGVIATGAIITAGLLAYVVAAGAGAWLGMRERQWRLDTLSRTGARRWYADRAVAVGALMGAVVLGFLLAVVVVALELRSSPYRYGTVDAGAVAASALMIAMHVPLGYLVGRATPKIVTPAVVAAGVFVGDSVVGSLYGRPSTLFVPAASVDPSAFVTWNGHVFLAQAVWFAGVATALLLVVVVRRERSRGVCAGASLAGVALLVGGWLVVPYHGARFAPGTVDVAMTCVGSAPRLCVPPPYREVQPDLQQAFEDLMQRVPGTPAHADVLELRPRGLGQDPSPGARAIHLDRATADGASIARQEYVESLLKDVCWDADRWDARPWEGIVNQWLTSSLADPSQDSQFTDLTSAERRRAARTWFESLTPRAQHRWFVKHYSAFTSCRLSESDFG